MTLLQDENNHRSYSRRAAPPGVDVTTPGAPGERHLFLVRVWRNDGETDWRASLLAVEEGETRHYASIAELYCDLCVRLEGESDA